MHPPRVVPGGHLDRTRGALLGAACGDGLGEPFEGMPRVDPVELGSWLDSSRPVRTTDDTVMTGVLARHLARTVVRGRGLDQDALMQEFLQAYREDPGRGYGAGTLRLFERVGAGEPWQRARWGPFSDGSLGNGAAMRVAPVGLLPSGRDDIAGLARRSAELTHAHPLGVGGAVLQACAVAAALTSDPAVPLERGDFLDQLARSVDEGYATRLEAIRDLPGHAAPGDVAGRVGNDVTATAAVPAAVAAFLRFTEDPGRAIEFAISVGGDTDTIATMCGALAGARCGESALPAAWVRRVGEAERLRGLADELASMPA